MVILTGCVKQQAHAPVGGMVSDKDLAISQNRSRKLNETERAQIQQWISVQEEKFYHMGMNYWVNKAGLELRKPKQDGQSVSYEYSLFDFDRVKLYDKPVLKRNAVFGTFEELKAVDNVLRYLEPGDEVTLLVPSILAFGTYGDNDKIPYDMPLIIKLKVLQN